jgi:hypothetical protein
MLIHNVEIAASFQEAADPLEIRGDNPFRICAWRNAALSAGDFGGEFNNLIEPGADRPELPGVRRSMLAARAEKTLCPLLRLRDRDSDRPAFGVALREQCVSDGDGLVAHCRSEMAHRRRTMVVVPRHAWGLRSKMITLSTPQSIAVKFDLTQ